MLQLICVFLAVAGDEREEPSEGVEHQAGQHEGGLGGLDATVLRRAVEGEPQPGAPRLQLARPGDFVMLWICDFTMFVISNILIRLCFVLSRAVRESGQTSRIWSGLTGHDPR